MVNQRGDLPNLGIEFVQWLFHCYKLDIKLDCFNDVSEFDTGNNISWFVCFLISFRLTLVLWSIFPEHIFRRGLQQYQYQYQYQYGRLYNPKVTTIV